MASDPQKEAQARRYAANLDLAFKVMKIDTAQAQAVYLAHAFIESDQFRQFTETQGSQAVNGGKQKWADDPTQIQLDMNDLKGRYPQGGTVNPHGGFEFIGRGPVQVTHKQGYTRAVEMLEQMAAQYERDGAAGDMQACEYGAMARDAANAVKADPRQAANPEYTFLMSAAFMKERRADVAVGQPPANRVAWTGTDAPSGWVAGGEQAPGSPQATALGKKANAYARILPILLKAAGATK